MQESRIQDSGRGGPNNWCERPIGATAAFRNGPRSGISICPSGSCRSQRPILSPVLPPPPPPILAAFQQDCIRRRDWGR
ncbi:hypothetical protein BO70DRAFT_193539 [Aspergillus heteromorphus CBS 117.55]|uniref:Uncharacterized protein n=1 Tax=Aspergillus heteromorphus CBS 117.55 TaxID=1448321 RepID=A0A317WT17_9EURO|nr:uncharacterized protein BO70DRAFT_193539 [Aspergillus heteromorphus CBS 117.55]PWY87380.1 hypothetical protein BO70DRAFT_193539 [Aspergillus heteromorphus CBS 117.55]